MARRPPEDIWIECERGRFDRFRSLDVTTDIFGEAQAVFEVGDDRAWRTLYPLLAPGRNFTIYASGLLVFTGRIDCNELPTSIDDGTVIQVVMRTRMADARVAGATQRSRSRTPRSATSSCAYSKAWASRRATSSSPPRPIAMS